METSNVRTVNTNFKSNKRGGLYWKNGTPYLSVTEILKCISKPALTYWFGQQVYYAMVANPSLNESEALASPYKVSETAKLRGTAVHSIVEAYKQSGVKVDPIPALKPFSDAFFRWTNDFKVQMIESEKTVFSEKHRIAGTLDLLATLNGEKDVNLIDIKTSKDGAIYVESFLQDSAYQGMLAEGGTNIKRCFVLSLAENGTYTFKEAYTNFDAFLHTKALYEFLNKEKLEKLGYLTIDK